MCRIPFVGARGYALVDGNDISKVSKALYPGVMYRVCRSEANSQTCLSREIVNDG